MNGAGATWLRPSARPSPRVALEEAGPSSASEDRMAVGWEVLQDHKSIWFELSRIWELVNEVKDKLWLFDLLLDLLLVALGPH